MPYKDDKPKYTEIALFQAGSDCSLSARVGICFLTAFPGLDYFLSAAYEITITGGMKFKDASPVFTTGN